MQKSATNEQEDNDEITSKAQINSEFLKPVTISVSIET